MCADYTYVHSHWNNDELVSKNNISYSYFFVGNLYNSKRQERYDDSRRRKNDTSRQNSGRANKYDSNRNYRGKQGNDSYEEDSPTNYNKKRNQRYNKGSNSQIHEKSINTNNSPNGDIENGSKYNSNMKNDKYEPKERKRYDGKPNRNGKSNVIKIDLVNCSQREKLSREIDTGRLECLVCYDMIKPYTSVWSCPNCYHIMHLNCIIKWAESSKSEEGWRCCACQNITKNLPREYFCFCGKAKNPQYNRNDMAHSCGETCGRSENCPHPCTQLCHPGPCPQCQVRYIFSISHFAQFII